MKKISLSIFVLTLACVWGFAAASDNPENALAERRFVIKTPSAEQDALIQKRYSEQAEFPQQVECLSQLPDAISALLSDLDADGDLQVECENFVTTEATAIEQLQFWGIYAWSGQVSDVDCFSVIFREDDSGQPGAEIGRLDCVPATTRETTGELIFDYLDEYVYTIDISPPQVVGPGTFYVEIYNNTVDNPDSWWWETGYLDEVNGILGNFYSLQMPESWVLDAYTDLALVLTCEPVGCVYIPGDCDHNGTALELGDVIAMIGMYRGSVAPPYECPCPPHGDNFTPTADPNGNCIAFELGDVVTEIGAYRGTGEASGCVDCPGQGRLLLGGNEKALIVPTLKSKIQNAKGDTK